MVNLNCDLREFDVFLFFLFFFQFFWSLCHKTHPIKPTQYQEPLPQAPIQTCPSLFSIPTPSQTREAPSKQSKVDQDQHHKESEYHQQREDET